MGTRCADHVTPPYLQKLALSSPTGGGRSVGIVRSRTKATEFSCGKMLKKSYILNFIIDTKFNIQNKIFVISVLGLGGVVFDCLGKGIPPP